MREHRDRRGHRQWMFEKRARENRLIGGWIGIISVVPHATIEGIHVFRLAGYGADGQSSADDFPICSNVGLHTKPGLGAAGVNAKTSDHLIKDQRDTCLLR